ncbi:unnamed protein product [Lepeophtheirus salmonis]|uniref:(salmon louse) hypothetical protein n=1 Tax=Lepeophtheirus salmonis TaxID=72036 RepID=A0A7R8H2Z5_LEPSM|nr:unnamed protein product [Lepeophtheirus salmonis]CAF2836142.1 unnamed protein product [Lepeophtheirus salmonis]
MLESMRGRFSNKFHFDTICGICSSLSTEGDYRLYFDLDDFVDEYPLQSAKVNLLIFALKRPIGYVLNGLLPVNYLTSTSCLLSNAELSRYISSCFMMESLGINSISHEAEIYSMLDQIAIDNFKQSVKFDGKRYTVKLFKAKLGNEAVNTYFEEGFAEKCSIGSKDGKIVNYMPLSAIFKEKSISTKVRIVFDSRTLNKKLCAGPSLIPKGFDVLIRFRRHKIAVVTDVRKMFLQIEVDVHDRDALRYLWKNLNINEPLQCIYTIIYHAENNKVMYNKESKVLLEDLCVDDLLTGEDSVEAATLLVWGLQELMAKGGFTLAKWSSSHPETSWTVDEMGYSSLKIFTTQI